MQNMNPESFDKHQDESDVDYSARLKTVVKELSSNLGESKSETQRLKVVFIVLLVVFFLTILAFLARLYISNINLDKVMTAHSIELKKLQDEKEQLKRASEKPVKAGLSAEEMKKIVEEKCEGKTAYLPAKPAKPAKPAAPPVAPVSSFTARGSAVTSSSAPTHCRWASNGTLRLKSNPLRVLPEDTTVATFPKADLKAGETCGTWQKKLEATEADLTPRDKGTLR